MPYPEHHRSASILIRAAKTGARVITSDRGWPGQMATKHNPEITVNVSNPDQFAAAIGSMFGTSATMPSQRSQEFLRFHTRENYLAHWTDLLGIRHNIQTRKPVPFENAALKATARSNEFGQRAA